MYFCVTFLLLSLLDQADPLTCYMCSSTDFPGCNDPFNYNTVGKEISYCDPLRNSNQTYHCTKEVFYFGFYAKGEELKADLTVRRCSSDLNNDMLSGTCPLFMANDMESNITQVKCSLCDTNLCNRTGSYKPILIFIICLALTMLLLY